MYGYNGIYEYMINYFSNKMLFSNFNITKTVKGLKVNLNKDNIMVENDEIMGWHCYGNVENVKMAEIIENDLELFLDSINVKYYFESNSNESIFI